MGEELENNTINARFIKTICYICISMVLVLLTRPMCKLFLQAEQDKMQAWQGIAVNPKNGNLDLQNVSLNVVPK